MEVRISNDKFFPPILFLLQLLQQILLISILCRLCKDSLEIPLLRERVRHVLRTGHKNILAFILRVVNLLGQRSLRESRLFNVRESQVFELRLIRLLCMLVPILAFVKVVEAVWGAPARLTCSYFFNFLFIFVHNGECTTEEVF